MFCNFQRPALDPEGLWAGCAGAAPGCGLGGTGRAVHAVARHASDLRYPLWKAYRPAAAGGVPLMTLEAERETLVKYHRQAESRDMARTRPRRAPGSIDGLPTRASDHYIAGERED